MITGEEAGIYTSIRCITGVLAMGVSQLNSPSLAEETVEQPALVSLSYGDKGFKDAASERRNC